MTGVQTCALPISSEVSDGRLGGLGLLLSSNDRDQGHVEDGKVLVSDSELELSHRLNERSRLNVSNSSTELQIDQGGRRMSSCR